MKYLLLAKSNVKKTKGLTVGLFLLISIAACFFNVFLLINMDFNKNAKKTADKLNTEDIYISLTGNINSINESYIHSIIDDDVLDFEITNELGLLSDLPFHEATVSAYVYIGDENIFNKDIGRFEILDSDESIHDHFIYLPYQFNTGGGYQLGDIFKLKLLNKEYQLKIKGFTNNITFGSNNVGAYQLILDNSSYTKIKQDSNHTLDTVIVKFKVKDHVDLNKFLTQISNRILKDHPNNFITSETLENAIFGRTFLGIIFGALLLIVCAIVLFVVLLMISNNISNFIRENIKTLGALKAIGYTSKDITIAFIVQFIAIDWLASVFGICLSIFVMQMIGDIMVIQSAIPYTAHFRFVAVIVTVISLLLVILVSLLFLLRKTKNIEPIVALREGFDGNKTKKSIMPLEKSKAPLSLNLSMKIMYTNKKQNMIMMIVIFFLIMMSSLSLVLFQNFTVKPKTSIMTFELCDGVVTTDSDLNLEVYHYLENMKNVENVRLISYMNTTVEEVKLFSYIMDDVNKLENKDVIYKGNFPKEDEIVVSGKFASTYGYQIGDVISIDINSKKRDVKITGFMQTLNNSGSEAILTKETVDHMIGTDYDKQYYFNISEDTKLEDVFDQLNHQFDSKIKSTIDFKKLADGALSSFQMIAFAIVILVCAINVSIILLVLYMLMKTLINKKKKDYGILKSIGYTSKQIIFENACSFLPAIIISVIVASIVSIFTMNKIIGIVMGIFGVMQLNLDMPILLIFIFGFGFIILSFIISLLLSRKIKKIEPYKLLIGE